MLAFPSPPAQDGGAHHPRRGVIVMVPVHSGKGLQTILLLAGLTVEEFQAFQERYSVEVNAAISP